MGMPTSASTSVVPRKPGSLQTGTMLRRLAAMPVVRRSEAGNVSSSSRTATSEAAPRTASSTKMACQVNSVIMSDPRKGAATGPMMGRACMMVMARSNALPR